MEKFEDGEKITRLPCGHIFKKEAIYEWVYNKSNESYLGLSILFYTFCPKRKKIK